MMPKKIAAGILIAQEKNLDPNVLLNQARELVKRNYATVKNLPGVTTGSGRRAVSESELMSLEIEPVVGPTGDVVHVSVAYKNDKGRLSTSGKTKAGGAIYLGSIDRGDETLEMVFITCAIQR